MHFLSMGDTTVLVGDSVAANETKSTEVRSVVMMMEGKKEG